MSSQNDRFQDLRNQIEEIKKRQKHEGEKISTIENSLRSTEKNEKMRPRESITNILLAVFNGLLFIGAMLQWSAARDAIKDTHRSFQIGTRAWVIPKSAIVQPTKLDAPSHGIVQEGEGIKDSQAPVVSVTLINSGHSPARELKTIAHIEVTDKLISDDYVFPPNQNPLQSDSVLAPDGISVAAAAYGFRGSQFDDVKNGRKFLSIYGVSTYLDIFGDRHQTNFCYFYQWENEKMVACPHFNFAN
jgi:hypothetical protein